jgi:hypothetical protein
LFVWCSRRAFHKACGSSYGRFNSVGSSELRDLQHSWPASTITSKTVFAFKCAIACPCSAALTTVSVWLASWNSFTPQLTGVKL